MRLGQNDAVRPHPERDSARPESPEIAELLRLRSQQPDLSSAINLQIELLRLERRVQGRIPLPTLDLDAARLAGRLARGHPLLEFPDIPLNWSDFRFVFRSVAELMRQYEVLDEDDYRRTEVVGREANLLEPLVTAWFATAVAPSAAEPPEGTTGLEPVVQLAMRPFLSRCAEVFAHVDFAPWTRGCCPVCGGEPEFAAITPGADRLLICSRCLSRWKHDPLACPFCSNADRSRITSLASRDGLYRVYACDECRRYLKAFDGRHAPRQVMVAVDTIATLPFDAAAMQRGYRA